MQIILRIELKEVRKDKIAVSNKKAEGERNDLTLIEAGKTAVIKAILIPVQMKLERDALI